MDDPLIQQAGYVGHVKIASFKKWTYDIRSLQDIKSLFQEPIEMFISHRVNTLNHNSARIFEECDGIEFDIRDSAEDLIVQHDAFSTGQLFSDFLTFCPSEKFYIVNVKSEGIEERAIQMLEEKGITTFFLLDCGMPAIQKLVRKGERRLAIRFSEWEPLELAEALQGLVDWVWVDVFSRLPLTKEIAWTLRSWGYKLCLVSPELQAQPEKCLTYKQFLIKNDISLDAVCSKQYNRPLWLTDQTFSREGSLS
jgi:hypothetical protein